MVAEGFIPLVWASAAQGFYGGPAELGGVLASGGPGQVVHDVCTATIDRLGGVLAVLGVVVLPITSGDTALRVARPIVGDYLKLSQQRIRNRYLVALPMFTAAAALDFVDFTIIWRYFGWANQTLAAVTLWTGAVYLTRQRSRWWLAAFPATFMTLVTLTFIMVQKVGLGLSHRLGTVLGLGGALAALGWFLAARPRLAIAGDAGRIEARPSEAERA